MAKEASKKKKEDKKKQEPKTDFNFESGIKGRVVTEKSFDQADALKKYSFYIDRDMNKIEARKMIEKKYSVKVAKVNVITVPGKLKRTRTTKGINVKRHQDRKKVVFTLEGKDEIKNFTQI